MTIVPTRATIEYTEKHRLNPFCPRIFLKINEECSSFDRSNLLCSIVRISKIHIFPKQILS